MMTDMELKATTVYDAYWKATSNGDNSIPVYLKSEADKVIAELKEERRWRKCSKEKPPHSGIYLVCIAGHVRTLDTFDSDRNLWRNYNPTHWMPLPSAPKEENK